jgi:hypothetical protein
MIAADLSRQGHDLLVIRDFDTAKQYLTFGTAMPTTKKLGSDYSPPAETEHSKALGSTPSPKATGLSWTVA